MKSLAEALGLETPPPTESGTFEKLADITDSKAFALAVLDSREFREYILLGLRLGDLPGFSGILARFMDRAWGKTPDRVEHTGKDGEPIVTEVRRVVIHVTPRSDHELEQEERSPAIH